VSSGLFRWVSNPMYHAYETILVGEALLFGSVALAAYAAGFAALAHVYVVRFEEKELARRFGDSYRRYCDAVPRWLPKRPTDRAACLSKTGRIS